MRKITLILIVALLFSCGDSKPKERISKAEAKLYAETSIKKLLKSPTSAKFSNMRDTTFEEIGILDFEGYLIDGTVSSQNSFGAMLQSNYSIEIHYDKSTGDIKTKNAQIK